MMNNLEFGWFLPTRGDTLDYAVPQQIPPSPEMFKRVVKAAEDNGFEYILLPVAAARFWCTAHLASCVAAAAVPTERASRFALLPRFLCPYRLGELSAVSPVVS